MFADSILDNRSSWANTTQEVLHSIRQYSDGFILNWIAINVFQDSLCENSTLSQVIGGCLGW